MFDLLNITLVLAFAFIGFYRGFVREISGLAIFALSAITALHFSIPLDYIISKSLPFPLFSTILSHLIVFATVMTTVKLFFLKTIIQHVRFISTGPDGILGALFGGLKGLMASLLVFSCLYISGAGIVLGINKTWFYELDHALYNKLALFVTSAEIATLGKIKHVQNIEDNDEEEIELSKKTSNNIDPQISSDIKENLNTIINTLRDKAMLNSQDDKVLMDTLSTLPDEKINSIFEICCKNIQQTKEMLNFGDNELSVYIGDLIINEYRNNSDSLDEIKMSLAKKIEHLLSKIYARESKEEGKTDTDVMKISTNTAIAPLPLKNPRLKQIEKKHVKVKEKLPPHKVVKSKSLPAPHRKLTEVTSQSIAKSVIKKPIVKATQITQEEDEDINTLIEESLRKSK